MSASNKKQQRKAAMAEGLTQKQRQEQAEAQIAKRKKTAYTIVGTACAAAAIALLLWNNMSSWQERSRQNSEAATVGGQAYSVADLQYYYSGIHNYYYQIAAYVGYNTNLPDGAQWYNEEENKTYADFFRESALTSLQQTAALCAAANAEGYTLSAEGQKNIDDQLAQIDILCARYGLTRSSYFSQQYGSGVTEKVFLRNLTNDILAEEYSKAHEAGISYDDAALREYYDSHPDELDSYDYRYFFISGTASNPTDADGNPLTDENGNPVTASDEDKAAAMAEAKKKANEAVADISSANDKDAAFAEAAPKYVAENVREAYVNDPDYSLATGVVGNTLTSNGGAYAAWLMDSARKEGDVTSIESANNGYYVVMFKERSLKTDPTVDVRHILIRAETSEGAEVNENGVAIPTQEQMDAAKAEAQNLMDQWKAGDKTAESFGELANEHSDDGGSNTTGGEYTHVYKGQMVANFNDWCFDSSRQSGDVGLVENAGPGYYGWHVIYFEGSNAPYWEHLATQAKQSTDQSEWLSSLTEATEAVALDGMNYVGDRNTAVPSTPTPAPSESPTESQAAE